MIFTTSSENPCRTYTIYLLFRIVNHTRLPNDRRFDLAGILQLCLDFLGDIVGQGDGRHIVHLVRLHHDADLAPGLDGVAAVDAVKALGDFLQTGETLQIGF